MYGGDEVSTINQRRLVLARRIVSKLVVSNAMSDTPELADRMISHPRRHGERSLRQIILQKVRPSPAEALSSCSPALRGQHTMYLASCGVYGRLQGQCHICHQGHKGSRGLSLYLLPSGTMRKQLFVKTSGTT